MRAGKKYKLFLIPYAGQYITLDPREIKYIQSSDNYCRIASSSGVVYLLRITLTEMESRMSEIEFHDTAVLRVHERCIISLKYVTGFDKLRTTVYFGKDVKLPVSRKYRKLLDEHLYL